MTKKEVEMYYKQAMTFLGQEEVERSLEFFNNALDIDDQYAPAWNNKGVALLSLKRYEEALNCFEHVIELNPLDNMVLYNKGYCLLMLKEYRLSVDTLELYLKRSKKKDFHKFALYLQAQGFYHLKNYENAEALLLEALKKDKNFKEAHELLFAVLKEKDSGKS